MGIVIDFYNKRFDSPNTLVMLPTVEDPSSAVAVQQTIRLADWAVKECQ